MSAYPRAPAKGQPTMALAATEKTATGKWPRSQAAVAVMVQYMVKELGRSAEHEMNRPVLNNRKTSVSRPVLAPKCLHMPLR